MRHEIGMIPSVMHDGWQNHDSTNSFHALGWAIFPTPRPWHVSEGGDNVSQLMQHASQ
jgi:hypothetical protein